MNNANGGNIIYHFKGDTSGLSKTISSIGSMTKSILVATGITKALSTAWNMVSSSTGDAIERFDQLNAFPRVMSSLGVSTEKSEKAVKKLSDKLKGLPTTLNSATSAVSRFVATNGDVEKSTEMFLAVNNAIIAGNAPMENQQHALEQLIQAYSKGKPDMMEWRSLLTAMPGQMKQVAKAMGYMDTNELHDALIEGTASMDDFMNAIVRLNTEGGEGFASFTEQAQNAVGGINTAITNMKTAITRGVEDIISSLDTGLKEGGVEGGIAGIIGKIGEGFETGLKEVGKVLGENLSGLLSGSMTPGEVGKNLTTFLMNGLEKGLEFLIEKIPEVLPQIMEFLFGVINAISDHLPEIIPLVMQLVGEITKVLTSDEVMTALGVATAKLVQGLVVGLVNGFTELGKDEQLKKQIGDFGIGQLANTFISFGVPIFTRTGRAMMVGLYEGILDALGISDKDKESIKEGLKGFIDDPLTFFAETGRDLVEGLTRSILEWLGIKTPGKHIGKGVKENVGDGKNWLYDVGKNVVQGLIDGINNLLPDLFGVAGTIATVVGNVIKKKNEIHSPSRLMEYYGEMLGEGYINGIDKMKEAINQTAMNTFSLSPQLTNSMALNNSPNVVVNNYVSNETDPLGQTVSQIKTFANGAKNDYNYGMGV